MPSQAAKAAAYMRRAVQTALKCADNPDAHSRCQGPASHYQRTLGNISLQAHLSKPHPNPRNPSTTYHFEDHSALTITTSSISPPTCTVQRPYAASAQQPATNQNNNSPPKKPKDPIDPTVAPETRRSYLKVWKGFLKYCADHHTDPATADTQTVAGYLTKMAEAGTSLATLRLARAALRSAFHQMGRLTGNPATADLLKNHMRHLAQTMGNLQKQATPLDAFAMEAIRKTATLPRTLPSGRAENPATATRRGLVDIAIASLMREALLRISETSALTWSDLTIMNDSTARLLIRRSKTDQEAHGRNLYIGHETTLDLLNIRGNPSPHDPIFNMKPKRIAHRLTQAAAHAGLPNPITGHSPRVGMAQDLAAAGIELPALMTAGRWKHPAMPARYIENITADRGAIAQYHERTKG